MTIESEPVATMPSLPPPVSKRSVDDTNSPATRTPARFATPPPPDRGRLQASRNGENSNLRSARASGRVSDMVGNRGVDADTLSRALSREFSADRRESTPGASPSRKRQRINADRSVFHAARPRSGLSFPPPPCSFPVHNIRGLRPIPRAGVSPFSPR